MDNIFMQGAIVSVIGLITVFVVLAILWGILEIMRVIFTKESSKSAQEAPAPAQTPVPPFAVPQAAPAEDDDELIAVLTAAIAAVLDAPVSGLTIRSYRRIDTTAPVWNRVARQDNLNRY